MEGTPYILCNENGYLVAEHDLRLYSVLRTLV